MLQKPTYETMGLTLLSKSHDDPTKMKKSGDLQRKLRRIQVMKKVFQSKIECCRKNIKRKAAFIEIMSNKIFGACDS